jgi:nucleoside-diphosphate-sugar epimerase
MRVLFVGGTGAISTACTQLAPQLGIDLTLLNRGRRPVAIPAGVKTLTADIDDIARVKHMLDGEFDAIVDWIAFTSDQVERDIRLFAGHTRQYVFISSASAYQKPATRYLITESTPLANPHWEYSRNKIACEERLLRAYREEGFPVTIVRPSYTYGDTCIPYCVNSWEKQYTVVDRMLRGKKIIVPGDGSSLWVLTHNSDFAKGFCGLLGHRQAIGHAFHITSDEVLTWEQICRTMAEAAGVEANIIHIPSDYIVACLPQYEGGLIGDKSVSVVFDNSKIKRFVPGFCATTTFAQGIRRTLACFNADPARRQVDEVANAMWDKLIAGYESGLQNSMRSLQIAQG